ncbi:hypothetical protein OCGS_1273 [Oceaniovalibus guishaninsula JLT2003]|uniref:Prepilin type IV endopeptidase peptidase domain-containing protein n=1 Tax=Oceaniovalibus guishaninsula JLT2003 TaxID=1231392 RepID=K2I619_9RHOB|nr:prepilin peptidase [Oceaniovalibus guishaninsula]EKE44435.1 hypothetical protein OCGS_1273 [Oceaniovalibus guishaninsula JLT2003]
MIALPPAAAVAFLVATAPVALWIAWTDLSQMRIPNRAPLALLALFASVGPFVLPLNVWAWQWINPVVVIGIGFVLNLRGGVGAGDAKFAAAASVFVLPPDAPFVLMLLAAAVLGAVVTHRIVGRLPTLRMAGADWRSWSSPRFPMGFALGPVLVFYLAIAALS